MPKFSDTKGREWVVSITVGAIRRVIELENVNLARIDRPRDGSVLDTSLITELTFDIELLVNVVYALVKPQADAMNPPVTPMDFAEALDGGVVNKASEALWSALENFFQHSRPDLVATIRKQVKLTGMMAEAFEKKVAAADLDSILGRFVSSLPGNAESTPKA